jgi:hypothetical protein
MRFFGWLVGLAGLVDCLVVWFGLVASFRFGGMTWGEMWCSVVWSGRLVGVE